MKKNPEHPVYGPEACYVCGSYGPHEPRELHEYWSNADAEAHFAAEAKIPVEVTYPDGTHSAEAHYVAEYRPY